MSIQKFNNSNFYKLKINLKEIKKLISKIQLTIYEKEMNKKYVIKKD